ncbi:glycosyltransferase [Marichromatium sp. PS1]|uniref:glycosyltransferase n=1 Tax=Marichromatium sp. PS1 TaxID=3138932 RepID=UPI0034E8B6DE
MERVLCFDGGPATTGLTVRDDCLVESLRLLLSNTAYATGIRLYLPGFSRGMSEREEQAFCSELSSRVGLDLARDDRIEIHPQVSNGLSDILSTLPASVSEVMVVGAGFLVPPGWDTRLRSIAKDDALIGCISPLCMGVPPLDDGAGLSARGSSSTGAVDAAAMTAWLDNDRLVAALGATQHLQLPILFPQCCYLTAQGLSALRAADRDLDPVVCLERAGLVSLVALNLLTAKQRGLGESSALSAYIESASKSSKLLGWLRTRLDEGHAPAIDSAAVRSSQPVQLHIAHSWGGGLGHWVDDFIAGDSSRVNLVLKSIGSWGEFGQRLELYSSYSAMPPLRVWSLTTPITETALANLDYRAVLREILSEYQVQGVIVSSLIGHSLDVFRTGLPTLLVAHDHYPFCIALYSRFNDVCASCDGERLRACMKDNPGHQFFTSRAPEDWEALRAAFVGVLQDNPVTLVTPVRSVLERWRTQMPQLESLPAHVIPHGLGLSPSPSLAGEDAGRLRVVIPGKLSEAKGLKLLEQVLPALARFADIYLIGCGVSGHVFSSIPGVHLVEHYARGEIQAELSALRPHVGLLCSLVPETFSYTLGELQHYGIPVVATRVGSFVDRIDHGETGFLCDLDAGAVVELMRALDDDREGLSRVRGRLEQTPPRTLDGMVADYHRLLPVAPVARGQVLFEAGPRQLAKEAIYINPQSTYKMAAYAFFKYSLIKVASSPRLPSWLKSGLGKTLRLLKRLKGSCER